MEGNRTVPVVIGDCVMWTMIPSSFCKSYGKIPSFFLHCIVFFEKMAYTDKGKSKRSVGGHGLFETKNRYISDRVEE